MPVPEFKKLLLLLFVCACSLLAKAQNINWMLGTWNGNGNQVSGIKSRFIKTIVIDSVGGENFSGTRTTEVNDRSHAKIITSLSGYINKGEIMLQNGAVLYKKDPSNGEWFDCSLCTPQNRIFIKEDSIILSSHIAGCQQNCDGTSIFYRLLCEYDSITQRFIVGRFGTAADIASLKTCEGRKKQEDSIKTAIADAEKRVKHNQDSMDVAKRVQDKRIRDSLETAAAYLRMRHKEAEDSTNAASASAKKLKQQRDDSLAVIKKRQSNLRDSLANATVFARKKSQQTQDSLVFARQRDEQRLKDSVAEANVIAKRKQKEIDDSTSNATALTKKQQQQAADSIAAAKKRQKKVDDSLAVVTNIAKQKEQQRIKDSLDNAASIAKQRQQEINDSTNNAIALAKQRQQLVQDSIVAAQKLRQHIEDSLTNIANISKQKEQQHIKDSLANAAIISKKRQQFVDDSTKTAVALAKKRQQQIDDSLVIVKKRQQEISDSLTNIANIARQREQKRLQDSLDNAVFFAKKNQQRISDSVAAVRKRQQFIEDSTNIAKNPVAKTVNTTKDSIKASTTKALETRTNVLLQTYHITSPDILIELFDNAQVDGDRVSVYHNNELIVNNQMLNKEAITYKIHADVNHRMHEFTMIAENLGTIPPNTALMRITVGTQTYKLGVKTDLQTNAKIVFYYDGN